MGKTYDSNIDFEEADPNPEYLIKSIAEQGYSLETSIADLIDNSISASANKVEIIIDTEKEPFTLYLADNGNGMDKATLSKNMKFPSTSPETLRESHDLGRFGLGMKTASFAQTREFTVLSRNKGAKNFNGRTWDVNYLKEIGRWRIIINDDSEIEEKLNNYYQSSKNRLNCFKDFEPNTIIIWKGLYKYENYIDKKFRNSALKKEISETTSEYLSLVFHRFIQRGELEIRVNNVILEPYDPFPVKENGFRPIEYRQKIYGEDLIKIEGYILPARAIKETREGSRVWVTRHKSLMDMEGVYIYRADRIIHFGGWTGLIKKEPRLQLARLKVDIGNKSDHLLHLNVAKSKVIIPHDLKSPFSKYVEELKIEAEREYYNRGIERISADKKEKIDKLFHRVPSNKGMLLEINKDFPILRLLMEDLTKQQRSNLSLLIRMFNTTINKIRKTHEDDVYNQDIEKVIPEEDLITFIKELKSSGIDNKSIKNNILPELGLVNDSIPESVMKLLG